MSRRNGRNARPPFIKDLPKPSPSREKEHVLQFTVTVRTYGHLDKVVPDVERTLRRLLDLNIEGSEVVRVTNPSESSI